MVRVDHVDITRLQDSGAFDAEWYTRTYPDVLMSGMDPVEHFLWIGARLGRRSGPSRADTDASAAILPLNVPERGADVLDALFIDGTNGTSSTPYRVTRIANGLALEGWSVRCENAEDLYNLMQQDIRPRFAIFHRAPYWSPFPEFVAMLRERGTIIVFDVDDLVFDEDVVPYIDAFRYMKEADRQGLLNGTQAYRNFILNADMCTSTTSFLVDQIRKLGKPTYRIRNAISTRNIQFFEDSNYVRKGRPDPFVVGYYSGTKTHQADFAVAATALIQFMTENADVVFRLVGEFDLDQWPELESWRHIHRPGDIRRVTTVGLMPHDVMIRDQYNCDLIIAPLEVGNPFCEAKSELKYFEASLAKCPVIASGTQTFIEASENGRLCDIAETPADWYVAFNSIYQNYNVAINRARHAYDQVRYAYSQSFAANEALEAYEDFASRRTGSVIGPTEVGTQGGEIAEVGVILPDFSGPSGGHRKIFSVCKAIEDAGLKVKLYFYSNRAPKVIKRDIGRLFFELNASVTTFFGKVDTHSILICGQWKPAYDARWVDFDGRIIYFMQDYEPLFYAAGSDHMRAMAASRLGFEIICYGSWVAAKLKDELGIDSRMIPFVLDHTVYSPPAEQQERDIDVLVYARPSQDRRCFDLIVEGLVKLKQQRPDVRIGLFGEKAFDDFGFAFTNYGSIVALDDLAALYHRTKVGICFSPTNPSQLGYEMLACGACLVDVRIKFSELNFDGEKFVAYCDGTPEDLARACLDLLGDEAKLSRVRKLGYDYVQAMPPEESLGNSFIEALGLTTPAAKLSKRAHRMGFKAR